MKIRYLGQLDPNKKLRNLRKIYSEIDTSKGESIPDMLQGQRDFGFDSPSLCFPAYDEHKLYVQLNGPVPVVYIEGDLEVNGKTYLVI